MIKQLQTRTTTHCRTDERTDGWTPRTDGRTYGRSDDRTVGRANERSIINDGATNVDKWEKSNKNIVGNQR